SEWHFILTPFSSPRKPTRSVVVDVLTTNEILYRGTVGDYHINGDGELTGILLGEACRFDRKKYDADRANGNPKGVDEYWRKISGHSFYLIGEKILNLNVTHVAQTPIVTIAEETLKSQNIEANVTAVGAGVPQPAPRPQPPPELFITDFDVCPHCIEQNRQSRLPRMPDTPLVSRSDGQSYHFHLLHL